jgi:hypothetical protein
MSAQVLRELLGRAVASRRVLIERAERDVVQISAELAPDAARRIASAFRRDTRRRTRDDRARRRRIDLGRDAQDFQRRSRLELERSRARQQLVQDDAERVDVTGHRGRLATDLLGAGVVRREHAPHRCGHRDRGATVGREQLRDSEVEEPRRAVLRDQDVVGLQITMNDEMLVRELHCVAHDEKQLEALFHAELFSSQ